MLQTLIKHPSKEKWTHYNTVKFKCPLMFKMFCHSPLNTISLTFLLSLYSPLVFSIIVLSADDFTVHPSASDRQHVCSCTAAVGACFGWWESLRAWRNFVRNRQKLLTKHKRKGIGLPEGSARSARATHRTHLSIVRQWLDMLVMCPVSEALRKLIH